MKTVAPTVRQGKLQSTRITLEPRRPQDWHCIFQDEESANASSIPHLLCRMESGHSTS